MNLHYSELAFGSGNRWDSHYSELAFEFIIKSNIGESIVMKKFQLIDENVAQQVCDHLKAFDKFNNLNISVQTINGLQLLASISVDDDHQFSFPLPQKDWIVGIPEHLQR